MSVATKPNPVRPPRAKPRKTPTLLEVQQKYGDTPVMPYDQHFLLLEGKQGRSIDKVNLIVRCAEELLADPRIGVHGMTTSMICDKAEISVGGIYRYFEDLVAVLDYIWPERPQWFKREVIAEQAQTQPDSP